MSILQILYKQIINVENSLVCPPTYVSSKRLDIMYHVLENIIIIKILSSIIYIIFMYEVNYS